MRGEKMPGHYIPRSSMGARAKFSCSVPRTTKQFTYHHFNLDAWKVERHSLQVNHSRGSINSFERSLVHLRPPKYRLNITKSLNFFRKETRNDHSNQKVNANNHSNEFKPIFSKRENFTECKLSFGGSFKYWF